LWLTAARLAHNSHKRKNSGVFCSTGDSLLRNYSLKHEHEKSISGHTCNNSDLQAT